MRSDLWNRTADAWFAARQQAYRCPHCAYDMRGLAAPGGFFRCPECGKEFERDRAMVPEPPQWGRLEPFRRPAYALLAVSLLAALLLGPLPVKIALFVVLLSFEARRVVWRRTRHTWLKAMPSMYSRPQKTAMDRGLEAALKDSEPNQT